MILYNDNLIIFVFIGILCLIIICLSNNNVRKDDDIEIVKKRIMIYKENILPIENYYKDLIVNIKVREDININKKIIKDILQKKGNVKKIIIIGPPGSGKTTIGKIFADNFKIKFISTGEIIRNEIKNNTFIGKAVKDKVEKGELVSSLFIEKILQEQIKNNPEIMKDGWILDGVPRKMEDIKILEKLNIKPDIVLNIYLPEKQIFNRINKRIKEN